MDVAFWCCWVAVLLMRMVVVMHPLVCARRRRGRVATEKSSYLVGVVAVGARGLAGGCESFGPEHGSLVIEIAGGRCPVRSAISLQTVEEAWIGRRIEPVCVGEDGAPEVQRW